jgi:acyl-coenzyme A thioesterase PaaI-like protein
VTESPAESAAAMLARLQASFDRQAMMATLGVVVTAAERGRVEMALRHDDRFTQQHGFLHAGAVASVMDTACDVSVWISGQALPDPAAVPVRRG